MVQKQLSTVCNEPGCVPVTLYLWICCCLVTKLCSLSCVWFIWDLVNCSLPGSSVHRISQARILECVAISFSRGLNPHLLHWPDSLPLTHQGNPVEYYSLIKMNKIVSLFERWMDLESVIQRWKSEREKQRLKINVYMWDGEEWHRWPYLQSRNKDSDIEN